MVKKSIKMEKTYKKIVKLIKELGTFTKIESQRVKVLDVRSGILILEPKSGWLGLRMKLNTTGLSNQNAQVYFTKVLYKSKTYPYCLDSDLKRIVEEIKEGAFE